MAAMPPIGFVGEVPSEGFQSIIAKDEEDSAENTKPKTIPPLGFVGEVPSEGFKPTTSQTAPPQPKKQSKENKSTNASDTLISALSMKSDDASGVISAEGKVEIINGNYILHADRASYNQKTDVMTADGNVALLMPDGEVVFAEHQEITGDMKQAFARNVGILFPDNSRLAAKTSERFEGRYIKSDQAVYTACNVCKENPDNPPLWKVRAGSVTHDNEEHKVYYHNMTLDFWDMPVLYTPYMAAPDPTVKRKQGFLSPVPGTSANIGSFLKTPYYIDISPDRDATITPTFSTKDNLQLDLQYRERFAHGKLVLNGSATKATLIDTNSGEDRGKQWRGHLFGNTAFDLNKTWRTGANIQYSSDRSYLHRYSISSIDQTTSDAYVEGFHGRNYTSARTYYFQNLRAGVTDQEPLVIPVATVNLLGAPAKTFGGRWSFDANTLVTSRGSSSQAASELGQDTRRLSLNAGWQRQLISSSTGLVTTVSGLARTDSYWAENVIGADGYSVYDTSVFTRGFGQANAVFRYPMGRRGESYQHMLEPIVALTAAPKVSRRSKQPIEDSVDVEFDETNLFSPNRFTGSDLIEGGSRITYGIRNAITADDGSHIDVFGGASYDFTKNEDFPELSGLNSQASDFVGRIDFSPTKWLSANYGFRLSSQDLSPQRQDAYISAGVPIFSPSLRYIEAYENNTAAGTIGRVRQATLKVSSRFTKHWTISGAHTQAFDPQPGPRSSILALAYIDECFAFGVNLSHDSTKRLDISSGTSAAFHLYLKNLGGLHTDSSNGIAFPSEFRDTSP